MAPRFGSLDYEEHYAKTTPRDDNPTPIRRVTRSQVTVTAPPRYVEDSEHDASDDDQSVISSTSSLQQRLFPTTRQPYALNITDCAYRIKVLTACIRLVQSGLPIKPYAAFYERVKLEAGCKQKVRPLRLSLDVGRWTRNYGQVLNGLFNFGPNVSLHYKETIAEWRTYWLTRAEGFKKTRSGKSRRQREAAARRKSLSGHDHTTTIAVQPTDLNESFVKEEDEDKVEAEAERDFQRQQAVFRLVAERMPPVVSRPPKPPKPITIAPPPDEAKAARIALQAQQRMKEVRTSRVHNDAIHTVLDKKPAVSHQEFYGHHYIETPSLEPAEQDLEATFVVDFAGSTPSHSTVGGLSYNETSVLGGLGCVITDRRSDAPSPVFRNHPLVLHRDGAVSEGLDSPRVSNFDDAESTLSSYTSGFSTAQRSQTQLQEDYERLREEHKQLQRDHIELQRRLIVACSDG